MKPVLPISVIAFFIGYVSITSGFQARGQGGIITTVAGNGTPGFSGDGGPTISASFESPYGIAVDASGNLFISDYLNDRIRKVSAGGIMTIVAGTGVNSAISGQSDIGPGGFSGDGGPAASASLNQPQGIAVDAAGNLFIADFLNQRIRKVSASGIITRSRAAPAALATSQVDSSTGLLETTVAGTTVLFNGIPAPIMYTSAGQVSATVPYETAGAATAQILVNYQGNNVAAGTVTVAPSAPGIFTVNSGTGQAAALNQDGSVNSASNPAAAGSTIVLYLTGEGQTLPPGADGKIASAASFPAPVLPVTVMIGGQTTAYS